MPATAVRKGHGTGHLLPLRMLRICQLSGYRAMSALDSRHWANSCCDMRQRKLHPARRASRQAAAKGKRKLKSRTAESARLSLSLFFPTPNLCIFSAICCLFCLAEAPSVNSRASDGLLLPSIRQTTTSSFSILSFFSRVPLLITEQVAAALGETTHGRQNYTLPVHLPLHTDLDEHRVIYHIHGDCDSVWTT